MHRLLPSTCLTLLLAAPTGRAAAPLDFAHQIAPILREHCADCHTGAKKKGGLSMNTRESLLAGGENGAAIVPGDAEKSPVIKWITSADPDERMPPKGDPVPAEQIEKLRQWIKAGAPWEPGYNFAKSSYEPPLRPRLPELPPALKGRDNPVDRILDADLARHGLPVPPAVSDGAFLRRAHLDLVGLLPSPEELAAFEHDGSADKRAAKVRELLARDTDYAEHWLTFWNDLLRNDYDGTGFITGGRKQITRWLYDSLVANKPYDRMTRELIHPDGASEGFANGIRWRGEVSAGQSVEIQFSQNVSQAFLGINMKCASCHDSFVDRWKLDEAFGLAAVFATRPLEIHRCDKPTGRMAAAAWLFPELGQIDAAAPQPRRLDQLAGLMTHPENGRYARTIVNRLWHRLMGRGIVHPVDAMQSEPWNADLLDFLGWHLRENSFDLKKTLELIATSQAYQSRCDASPDTPAAPYAGPRARRLTAEQFLDAVWTLTGAAPETFDAPVTRQAAANPPADPVKLTATWIWGGDTSSGRTIHLRGVWNLAETPVRAAVVISADNRYELKVNGRRVLADGNWETVEAASLLPHLRKGGNELEIVATNEGSGPNPAGAFLEARALLPGGATASFGTGPAWTWTEEGRADAAPALAAEGPWAAKLDGPAAALLSERMSGPTRMVRAALLKSDFLMRSLGRPNRDQIVSTRPNDLTTLEAIDLANGPILYETLKSGANILAGRSWSSPAAFTEWLFQHALCRAPAPAEREELAAVLGPSLNEQGVEDALWMVVLHPEFQYVR
ncbi:MAG: DUF1549 domain-containing protein [Kiritimatiellia bacterium]